MKILTTSNYSLFSCNPFQRKFSQGKVNTLKARMKTNGFTPSHAISVYRDKSGGLTINTGHHRLAAASELGIPVFYVIEHQWPISEMVDEGTSATGWDAIAVVSAFAKKGIRDYQELLAYADKGVPVAMAASMLVGEGAASSNVRSNINDGKFKIKTRKSIDLVISIIEEFGERIPAVKSRSFVSVFSKCLFVGEFDHATLSKRLRANHNPIEKTGSDSQMLKQIEKVYNHGALKRIPLSFLVSESSLRRQSNFGKAES